MCPNDATKHFRGALPLTYLPPRQERILHEFTRLDDDTLIAHLHWFCFGSQCIVWVKELPCTKSIPPILHFHFPLPLPTSSRSPTPPCLTVNLKHLAGVTLASSPRSVRSTTPVVSAPSPVMLTPPLLLILRHSALTRPV